MPAWILEASRTRVGPAIGRGLLVFVGLPILAVLALVTLVGIRLTLALLAALGLIDALGYSTSAYLARVACIRAAHATARLGPPPRLERGC
jgi:hypothetical protein